MARQKLKKFAVIDERENVIQPGKEKYETIKGNWRSRQFKNDNPIVLELACGRGEYSTGLAAVYPDKNFIGIDIKGDRLWYGSNIAVENGLENVAFLRTQIQHLENFFAENEVDEIWIVHPDPRPKKKDAKRRITHTRFLNIYKNILKPEGMMRFKTDNKKLFEFSIETFVDYGVSFEGVTFDLYESSLMEEHHGVSTRYERKFTDAGHDIHYAKFKFK